MKQQNYQCSITANTTAQKAFDCINHVAAWWGRNMEGDATKLNSSFTIRFGKTFGTIKVIEFEPYRKINWLITDGYLELFKDKQQWVGTNILWEISEDDNISTVTMTHAGLTPEIECFNDCEKGWNFYIQESLAKLITENKGNPGVGIFAHIFLGKRTYEGLLFDRNDPLQDFPFECLLIDVKEVKGEQVLLAYSVSKLDKEKFDTSALKGKHYMIAEDKPVIVDIEPINDLQQIVE